MSQRLEMPAGVLRKLLDGGTVSATMKAAPKTLYVRRDVLNPERFIAWAKAQGFQTALPPEDLHVTVCYSKESVDWSRFKPDPRPLSVPLAGNRLVKPLGSDGATVLHFQSEDLSRRHDEFVAGGASWDYQTYQPHVTITYNGADVDFGKVKPFNETMLFGPEVFEEINPEWSADLVEKTAKFQLKITKSDPEQMIAYGWATVIEQDGKPVVDSDNEVILEKDLESYVTRFVLGRFGGKVMHEGEIEADMVESMVFTREKQAALGIDLGKVGWWIGMKYRRPETWARIKSGELPMFSIAGLAKPRPITASEEKGRT